MLAHHGAVAREREDDSILSTMVVNSRSGMWLRDHSRGADVRGQADQGICSLHSLRLPTRGLQRRARLHNDWLLFGHAVRDFVLRPDLEVAVQAMSIVL